MSHLKNSHYLAKFSQRTDPQENGYFRQTYLKLAKI